jgi:hypothetical protein
MSDKAGDVVTVYPVAVFQGLQRCQPPRSHAFEQRSGAVSIETRCAQNNRAGQRIKKPGLRGQNRPGKGVSTCHGTVLINPAAVTFAVHPRTGDKKRLPGSVPAKAVDYRGHRIGKAGTVAGCTALCRCQRNHHHLGLERRQNLQRGRFAKVNGHAFYCSGQCGDVASQPDTTPSRRGQPGHKPFAQIAKTHNCHRFTLHVQAPRRVARTLPDSP